MTDERQNSSTEVHLEFFRSTFQAKADHAPGRALDGELDGPMLEENRRRDNGESTGTHFCCHEVPHKKNQRMLSHLYSACTSK